MKLNLNATLFAAGALLAPGFAMAQDAPICGVNTGSAATGVPIKIGGIHGNAATGDFSSATVAAGAYFACVNANGGIDGRPIEYIVENDQWNPELAAQAAIKLIEDDNVVAMVGNSSFVEMSVNAPRYAASNIMAMASGCAVSECFESPNIVSTNQGPLPSSIGAAMYAVEELGATNVSCIGLAIPSVGNWSCGATEDYMASKGLAGSSVLLNPAAPDANSGLLEAIASGADSILVNLPVGLAAAFFGVAQEQDLREVYSWTSSTPLYDQSAPAALGDYWDGKVYVSAELTKLDGEGPDNMNWQAVMDRYAEKDAHRDTFSQSGFLTAKFFTETLLELDPTALDDRAAITDAIKGISGKTSDLICGTYYVGEAERHMPNHAGIVVVIKDGGFELVRDCFEYEGPYFEPILEVEIAMGLR